LGDILVGLALDRLSLGVLTDTSWHFGYGSRCNAPDRNVSSRKPSDSRRV
jgi:hypothetical protein